MLNKLLNLKTLSTSSRLSSVYPSMLSLANKKLFVMVLRKFAWKVISVATSKTKVTPRLRRFNKFLLVVIKYYNHHGALSTVKWLKACHMAVQRKISSQPFHSLRELEKGIPMPRLINGLPSFIGSMDRKAIRNGCPSTIRLWLSILQIFRVIQAPVKANLSTITDKYQGKPEAITSTKDNIKTIYNWFSHQFYIDKNIKSFEIHRSLASGPNNTISIHSLISDAIAIAKYPEIYESIQDYCRLTKSPIMLMLNRTIDWAFDMLTRKGNSWVKFSKSVVDFDRLALGKLAFKEEAAGKLRIFAIVDIWTQSLFKPLHNSLFEFLKRLPNDGTFDQDASFRRCMEKAMKYQCAYSVDLSSATDRLPISLQAFIIDLFYGEGIGTAWEKILTYRPFFVRKAKYGLEENSYYYYMTGQPMGCLSSWAMLAVTHHFLVQVCAYKAYGVKLQAWFDKYEILGDDLVIFDQLVYIEYIKLMADLGVGINPSKSLISESLTSLEFAKRTGIQGVDVSGLSWKQLITESSVTGRVSFTLHCLRKGIIATPAILVKALSASHTIKFPDIFSDKEKDIFGNMIFGLLGTLITSNQLPLKSAVAFLVDPQDEDMEFLDNPKFPITSMLQYALTLVKGNVDLTPPLSDYKERDKVARKEVLPYMSDTLVREALTQITLFKDKYDEALKAYSLTLVKSIESFDSLEQAQLVSFSEWCLLKDRDPEDLFDEVYNVVSSIKVDAPPIDESIKLSEKVSSFISYFDIEPVKFTKKDSEVNWLIKDITNAGKLKGIPYWKALNLV